MPLYPYRCTKCGHRFEKIQKFDAEPEKACPQCDGVLERLLTAPGLQFKGAGWYVNDYAGKSGGSGSEPASTEKKAGTETKSEAKSTGSGDSGSTSSAATSSSGSSGAATS